MLPRLGPSAPATSSLTREMTLMTNVVAPVHWAAPATSTECALHQLAPYIGKLKSTIARDLVLGFSKPGDLIVDPFCGSGTVPLEGVLLGRRVIGSDISSYAATLTRAKLSPPQSEEAANRDARRPSSAQNRARPRLEISPRLGSNVLPPANAKGDSNVRADLPP